MTAYRYDSPGYRTEQFQFVPARGKYLHRPTGEYFSGAAMNRRVKPEFWATEVRNGKEVKLKPTEDIQRRGAHPHGYVPGSDKAAAAQGSN